MIKLCRKLFHQLKAQQKSENRDRVAITCQGCRPRCGGSCSSALARPWRWPDLRRTLQPENIYKLCPGDALYCTFSEFKGNGNCTKALTTYAPSAGAFATPTSSFSCTSWYQKAMQADRWTFRRFRDLRSKRKPPYLDCRQELAEPLVLLADLEGQLSGVAHHKYRDLDKY